MTEDSIIKTREGGGGGGGGGGRGDQVKIPSLLNETRTLILDGNWLDWQAE